MGTMHINLEYYSNYSGDKTFHLNLVVMLRKKDCIGLSIYGSYMKLKKALA